jgi:thiamine-phosphate pyrophosphorylase
VDAKLLAWGRAAAAFGKRQPPARRNHLRHPPADIRAHPIHPGHPPSCPRHDASCSVPPLSIPPLWLFTDSRRLPDPRAAVAKLPRGLAGVIYRHDDNPNRAVLGRDLARICRARRLVLVVAGDARHAAALRAGVHLRGGHWPGHIRLRGFITSSAHGFADLRRASRAGATLAFLSPVFATASHPEAPTLGPTRWSGLARHSPITVAALGGIDGISARRLPRRLPRAFCRAVGAIGALA